MNIALPLRCVSCLMISIFFTVSAGKSQATEDSLSIGDLAMTTSEIQLRKSRAINSYNTVRMLGNAEVVTINSIQRNWVKVQTEGDEFGWVPLQKLRKVKSRTIITKDWTELIGSSIGAIRACTSTLLTRQSETQVPRTIHIDPSLNKATITLFWDKDSSKGYRCTIGAYGGEVHRLQAFNRPDVKPDTMFTPTPGKPSSDKCYSNEIIFDRFRRTLGWISYKTC